MDTQRELDPLLTMQIITTTLLYLLGWPAPGGWRHWRGQERACHLRQAHRGCQTPQK